MSRVPLVGSAGRLAAVDGQDVAGDEAGVIRSYVEDRARDLVGLADPLLRIEGGEIGLDLLAAGEAVEHTGLDRSRRHRVDPDTEGYLPPAPPTWSGLRRRAC